MRLEFEKVEKGRRQRWVLAVDLQNDFMEFTSKNPTPPIFWPHSSESTLQKFLFSRIFEQNNTP
jgi:hypothetical protein